MNSPEYLCANPGFLHDFQLINVEDLNGRGETAPSPFFYQNLAEAEFVVATFIYMRMLGYVRFYFLFLGIFSNVVLDIQQKKSLFLPPTTAKSI